MIKNKINSFQEWLPFDKILDNGIIKLKNNSYIKIIKVLPINYNLKSELEKEAILNSYKLFLKTCDFDIQILIQSNKEELSKHISHLKQESEKEYNQNLVYIYKKYINFINNKIQQKNSSKKNFLILIKYPQSVTKEEIDEKYVQNNLNEKYYKIKECLSRCGNLVFEYNSKEETKQLLYTFFNYRNYKNENKE